MGSCKGTLNHHFANERSRSRHCVISRWTVPGRYQIVIWWDVLSSVGRVGWNRIIHLRVTILGGVPRDRQCKISFQSRIIIMYYFW